MSRTYHHRKASSVSSLSCSSFDTIEEEYMANETSWQPNNNAIVMPPPNQQQQQQQQQRSQTEITILACSSPEIQALHKVYYTTPRGGAPSRHPETSNSNFSGANVDVLPSSPTSSITSYSSTSRTNACIILSSLEHLNHQDNLDQLLSSDNFQTIEDYPVSQPNYHRRDGVRTRAIFRGTPQPPTRNINNHMVRMHESAPCSLDYATASEFNFDSIYPPPLNRSGSSDQRMPPPTSSMTLRKPCFHRRVSHDSLPSPTEIAAFPPPPMAPPLSMSPPSSPMAPPTFSSSSRPPHARNSNVVMGMRPRNLQQYPKFQC